MALAEEEGWYLYGVIDAAVELTGLSGSEQLRTFRYGAVQAVASRATPAEWASDLLGDHEVLTERVRHHHAVLREIMGRATPIPMRFGTIVRGVEGVERWLAEMHPLLDASLRSLDGKQEWGLKLVLQAAAEVAQDEVGVMQEGGEGRRYLLRKQQERAMARTAAEERRRLAAAVADEFAPLAEAWVSLPAREGLAMNEALLVSGDRVPLLLERQAGVNAELHTRGRVDLTGPWPPYSFAPTLLSQMDEGADHG